MKRKYLRNFLKKGRLEAGCDEAGRGCLAGPVFAAAVILPPEFKHRLLNDSKKIPAEAREELRMIVEEKSIAFGIGSASHHEIDEHNILQASFLAMHRAIDALHRKPEALLIDGNQFRAYPQIAHNCIIKGDAKFKNIAAASILAKTYRDRYMVELSQDFPHYDWHSNKGYGTAAHLHGIRNHGLSPFHRMTFTRGLRERVSAGLIHR